MMLEIDTLEQEMREVFYLGVIRVAEFQLLVGKNPDNLREEILV